VISLFLAGVVQVAINNVDGNMSVVDRCTDGNAENVANKPVNGFAGHRHSVEERIPKVVIWQPDEQHDACGSAVNNVLKFRGNNLLREERWKDPDNIQVRLLGKPLKWTWW
jgi:hypothetical protein